MPSVPTSKRCQRCKKRKIKCDENWPTCGPCQRSQVPCSGPPALSVFLCAQQFQPSGSSSRERRETRAAKSQNDHDVQDHHQSSSSSSSSSDKSRSSTPAPNVQAEPLIKRALGDLEPDALQLSQPLQGGGSFGRQRLYYDKLGRNPTTVADRVASRLVRFLVHKDAPWSFLTTVGYVRFLPSRLGQSAALRDCVALACSTWANYYKKVPASEVVDFKTYGKALRSMQQALNAGTAEMASWETLAAITILERIETLFDATRPVLTMNHANGIECLLQQLGPPSTEDDLATQLAFENHATLLSLWVLKGGNNFFLNPEWQQFMGPAIRNCTSVSLERRQGYDIGVLFGHLPGLIQAIRSSALTNAAVVRNQVYAVDELTQTIGRPIVQSLLDRNFVTRVVDESLPVGEKYEFATLDTLATFSSYYLMRCLLLRMMSHLDALQLFASDHVLVQHRDASHHICMCLPVIRRLGLTAGMIFLLPLYMAYDASSEAVKTYILDYIVEVLEYKKLVAIDRHSVERHIYTVEKIWTGSI